MSARVLHFRDLPASPTAAELAYAGYKPTAEDRAEIASFFAECAGAERAEQVARTISLTETRVERRKAA
jgi:hypothetical protein